MERWIGTLLIVGWGALSWAEQARSVPATDETTSAIPVLTIHEEPGPNPWTHLRLNNNPANFQFAIVTDRTGGVRPGIFEDAVRKLNLLQPEFVMSVGDLIMGYTHDRAELNRQWDEFESFVNSLQMPFFYVPGNHDVTNDVQKEIWKERFGRDYYHFTYGNVLFLCLNSEDPERGIGDEQAAYVARVLEENRDVRWTLVFLHRPLWIDYPPPAADSSDTAGTTASLSGWERVEALLAGRPHTVFAGHLHRYTRHVRHNANYIVLASTGGGSPLRGARPYGEFDHVVWVTMTDEGPILANLELSGIWDQDVVTADMARLVRALLQRGVLAPTLVTAPLPFGEAPARIRLTNDADLPLTITVRAEPPSGVEVEPAVFTRVVAPNSVEFTTVTLINRQVPDTPLGPVRLHWHAEYDPPGQEKVVVDGTSDLALDPKRIVPRRSVPVTIDGRLDEWSALPVEVRNPGELGGPRRMWKGPHDCSYRFAVEHDEEFVYVAVQVEDDHFVPSPEKKPLEGDSLEILLEATGPAQADGSGSRGGLKKGKKEEGKRGKTDEESKPRRLRVVLAPQVADGTTAAEKDQVRGRVVRTERGYSAEAAFPVAALRPATGEAWQSFRINVAVHDADPARHPSDREKNVLWWKPAWGSTAAWPEAGTFVRETR